MTRVCVLCISTVLLCACAVESPSRVDEKFGDSLKASVVLQTYLSPHQPVETGSQGMDGQAVKSSIDRYQKSFDTLPNAVNSLLNSNASGSTSH